MIKAQQALRQQGLYKGPVDGKFGPETRSAVTRFQKQNGLQQTAQLDPQTMGELQGGSGGGGSASSGAKMPSNSSAPAFSGSSSGSDKDDDNDVK